MHLKNCAKNEILKKVFEKGVFFNKNTTKYFHCINGNKNIRFFRKNQYFFENYLKIFNL